MRFIHIFIFLILSSSLVAQNKSHSHRYNEEPLIEVIADLERLYDVKFSYNPKTVEAIRVTLDLKDVTLVQILNTLTKETLIDFNSIDARYYTVTNASQIDVCGYLIERRTGAPLEGVTIINEAKNSQGTTTNAEGYFNLNGIDRTQSLRLSYLGYESVILHLEDLTNVDCKTYQLSETNVTLDEIILEEYLGSGIKKLLDGAVKMIPKNSDILAGLSEPDILHSAQLLPGIESPSETASGIYIRGGTPDQNLILWDGIKMYNSSHFFGMLSAFNPYIVDNVKVYRNGAQPKYGDRVAGVIDINTNNDIPNSTEAGIGINLIHADAYLRQPLSNKAALIISARRSITDLIDTPTFNAFSDKVFQGTNINANQEFFNNFSGNRTESFYFIDLTAKFIFKPTDVDVITLSSILTRNALDYSFEADMNTAISSDKLNVLNTGFSINWDRQWTDKFSFSINSYYSNYDFDFKNLERFSSFEQSVIKENTIKEWAGSIEGKWTVNDKISLTTGYQFFANKTSFLLANTDTVSRSASANTNAFYNQFSYKSSSAWHIDLGLRAQYIDIMSSVFLEPRLYTEYLFADDFRLKASAERRTQSISQIIEFTTLGFGLENQVWSLAEKDVTPVLKSRQFSTGFLADLGGWKLDLDIYHKRVTGLTSYTRGFQVATGDFENGSLVTNGLDVLIKKKLGEYSTWMGYTFSKTNFRFENINNGNDFSGNNDITNSFSWSHYYKWNDFQFSLGWKYRTGIPFTNEIGLENDIIKFDDVNGERLDDYHRLDISAVYNFKLSDDPKPLNAVFGVSVLNVYNKKNELGRNYIQLINEDNVNSIQEVNINSLGITPSAFFKVSW